MLGAHPVTLCLGTLLRLLDLEPIDDDGVLATLADALPILPSIPKANPSTKNLYEADQAVKPLGRCQSQDTHLIQN